MPRMILRMLTAIVVICIVCLHPTQMYSENLDNGPYLDPIIIDKSEEVVSLTCPPPITIDCDDNGIYASWAEFEAAGGSINLPDGCSVTSFSYLGDTELTQSGCDFVYMREYEIVASCSNTFTCNQIVMLTDDDDPFISVCAPDITLSMDNSGGTCLVAYTVPDITVTDGCSSVTVTNDGIGSYGLGDTQVTYTATDGCGNSSQCSFTITVEDTTPLTVSCPSGYTTTTVCDISEIAAYTTFQEFQSAGGMVTGNCSTTGNNFTISSSETTTGSCPKTVSRTYTVTDGAGNEGMCTQTILISDIAEPSFTVPAAITVDCGMSQDTSITGSPSNIMDNCDAMPTVTWSDGSVPLSTGCTGEVSITRSWIVTDNCMNADTLEQIITTVDTIAPIAVCKDTFVVYMDETGNADLVADSLDAGSTDNCSTLSFQENMLFVACNQVGLDIPTQLMVSDGCGNMSMCDMIVQLKDTMEVEIFSLPSDTFMCITDLEVPHEDLDDFTILDNCFFNSTVELESADTSGVCPIIVDRIYRYTDLSGNTDTALHRIYVIDEEDPVIVACPMDILIAEMDYCDTLITFGVPEVTDNCGEVVITNDYTNSTDSTAIFEGGVTVITFTATDACGNSNTCQMTVIVSADPKITFPPLEGDINSMADVPSYADLQAFLDAGGEVNMYCLIDTLTFTYTPEFDIEDGGCTAILTENVMFLDTLGNPMMSSQQTLLMDTLSPVFGNCANQFLPLDPVSCTFDTSFVAPSVMDNYGVDTTYYVVGEFVSDTAMVTYYAEDECGNIDSCEFQLFVLDGTAPEISVDNITIECDTIGAAPAYTSIEEFLTGPNAMMSDCRLDSMSFNMSSEMTDMDGNITRIYTIGDLYNNTGMVIQTITLMDGTPPTITCPSDTIVGTTDYSICGAVIDIDEPVIADNCGDMLTLTHDSPYTDGVNPASADGEYPVGTTTITYTVEDENGLTATCSFTVTVNDTLVPILTCPLDTIVECDISVYPGVTDTTSFIALGGTILENCDIQSLTSSTMEDTPGEYIRIYTATDIHGNEGTCTQNISVVDTIAPMITCVPMIIVTTPPDSCSKYIDVPVPTATDNCGMIDTIYNSLTMNDNASGIYMDTTSITWYAYDFAGNVDSCTYDIIVMDGTGPVIVDPDTTFVMCTEMAEMVDTFFTILDIEAENGSATDNCGIDSINIISEEEIGDSLIIRKYLIIDFTGNTSSLTHVISIDDTTGPDFDAPADATIDCSIAFDSLAITGTVDSMMLTDNCMEIDTLIYIDNVTAIACPGVNQVERIWILSDDSGNESRDTQYITTIDTIAPVFDSTPSQLADINCDDDLPPAEKLTATDNCTSSSVVLDTLPFAVNYCDGYDVTYRWIATDACGNSSRDSVTFSVLPDATVPQLVEINDQTLSTLPGTCGVPVDSVLRPVFEEDCVIFSMVSDFSYDEYPLDTTLVTWTVTNTCGLDTTVVQTIVVEDNEPPVVVCQDLNVSLGGDGIAYVQADTVAKTITDNCTHYFPIVKIRRIDGPTECDNDGLFNDQLTLCCEDIGKNITVEVQVTDGAGNVSGCQAEINVKNSKIAILQGLPDINISCEYVYNPENLSVFGSYVDDPADQEDIRIEDYFYQVDSIAGQDGLFVNTCDLGSVTETSEILSGECGRDTIIRYFKIKNDVDSVTLVQRIYQQDITLFNASGLDIEWPAAYEWNQCLNPAPDTSISGVPVLLNNDYCSLVSMSYQDQLFNYPLTSCPFVKRKWKVLDWCQYDNSNGPENNPGLWTYDQFIYVTNDVPPTILSTCADTLVCAPGNACEATVSLSMEAIDDCAADAQNLYYRYRIDINNDDVVSNDITGTTNTIDLAIPNGVHQVLWFVEDRCGNEATCDYLLTVKECKDPTPVCLVGLAIDLGGNPSVELWASDIDQSSSDNCTSQENLLLSFSSDPYDNVIEFDCDDLGNQSVELWVTDEAGNQSFCTTFVDVQDNSNYCNNLQGSGSGILNGKIATESNIAVPEAMVSIIGAEMESDFMTDEEGVYAFEELDMQNEYQISVERDKDYLEGVTTLDLVMIQRHLLGLSQLESPYKLLAADINGNEKISASDLLALRRLILGIDETLPDNTSWRFVSKNSEMEDMENPWPFAEDLLLDDASAMNTIDADFVAVKIGDVNNSIDEFIGESAIESRASRSLGLVTEDRLIRRDDQVLIDITNSSDINLTALQMTINWNPEVMSLLEVIPVGVNFDDSYIHRYDDGVLTIAWHSVDAKSISSGLPLFQLVMEGNQAGRLSKSLSISSEVTTAVAYNDTNEEYDLELRFLESGIQNVVLHQNKPNPFLNSTTIEFELPEEMLVTFKIFDNSGRLIYEDTKDYLQGENELTLDDELGDAHGILFLKMETAEFSEVKRMIRIE